MDIATRLDLFIDIVSQGSFAKAAAYRNIDRAVITKQFKALEDTLGVRLLNRTTRSIALTDAGREILKQAYVIRSEISKTKNLAESYETEPKGLLRVGSYVSFGLLYIQPVISEFLKKYPYTRIELTLDDTLVNIVDGELDLSFRVGPTRDSTNVAVKLAPMNLVVLASQSFVNKYGNPNTLEELASLPAVIYSSGTFCFEQVDMINDETQQSYTHKLKGNFQTNNVQSLISAVKSGVGYCIVDLSVLDAKIDSLDLVQLLKHYSFPSGFGDVFAVYPHRNQTAMVKEFIAMVKEKVGAPAKWQNYL